MVIGYETAKSDSQTVKRIILFSTNKHLEIGKLAYTVTYKSIPPIFNYYGVITPIYGGW